MSNLPPDAAASLGELLGWLFEEFESLSFAVENEYGFPGDGLNEGRERAKAIQELLRSQPIENAPSDWQPIETAPKDGSPFLGWCPELVDGPSVFASAYDYWIMFDEATGEQYELTHWMPLPDPPKD